MHGFRDLGSRAANAVNLLWNFGSQLLQGSGSFLVRRQIFRYWGIGIVVNSQDDLFLVYCGHVDTRADAEQKVYVSCRQNQQTTTAALLGKTCGNSVDIHFRNSRVTQAYKQWLGSREVGFVTSVVSQRCPGPKPCGL